LRCTQKTGIVDDQIGENDIYDNHFLYVMVSYTGLSVGSAYIDSPRFLPLSAVQLPEAEGYLLRSLVTPDLHRVPPKMLPPTERVWRKHFCMLKLNTLVFFDDQNELNPLGSIPLGSIAAVGRPQFSWFAGSLLPSNSRQQASEEDNEEKKKEKELEMAKAKTLWECLIRIRTVDNAVVLFLAETPGGAELWTRLLSSWRFFFALDAFAEDQPTGLGDGDDDDQRDDIVMPLSFVRAEVSEQTAEQQDWSPGPETASTECAQPVLAQEEERAPLGTNKEEEEYTSADKGKEPQADRPRVERQSSSFLSRLSSITKQEEGYSWLSPRRLVEAFRSNSNPPSKKSQTS